MDRCCRLCDYFKRKDSTCQRNPPVLIGSPGHFVGCWPAVAQDDWCGQFKQASDAAARLSPPHPDAPVTTACGQYTKSEP